MDLAPGSPGYFAREAAPEDLPTTSARIRIRSLAVAHDLKTLPQRLVFMGYGMPAAYAAKLVYRIGLWSLSWRRGFQMTAESGAGAPVEFGAPIVVLNDGWLGS
jgi:hypothetical protein